MLFLACETSFVDSANLDLFLNSHSVSNQVSKDRI